MTVLTTKLLLSFCILTLCLFIRIKQVQSEAFIWYERNYTKAEADFLLDTANSYWSMNNQTTAVGIGDAESGSLVEGPVNKALRVPSGQLLSSTVPGCLANTGLCETSIDIDTGFTVSMWFSLRPNGGLDYNKNKCLLIAIGDEDKRQTKIEFEGGPEHNLSFTVRQDDTQDSVIHISESNMAEPTYDVCSDWNEATNSCAADIVKTGWQWNHVALVYDKSRSNLKAYYNTYELTNVVQEDADGISVSTQTTKAYLYPGEGCGTIGFDEVAYWTKALSQNQIAILRLGPFGSSDSSEISTEGTASIQTEQSTSAQSTTDVPNTTTTLSPTTTQSITTADEASTTKIKHPTDSTPQTLTTHTTLSDATTSTAFDKSTVTMTRETSHSTSGTDRITSKVSAISDTVSTKITSQDASSSMSPKKSTVQTRTVNVAKEEANIKQIAEGIQESATAAEANTALQDTKDIISTVANASDGIDTNVESEIVDEIVQTGAAITKGVAASSIFHETSTSKAEKKNVRQQCLEIIDISSTLASQIAYKNASKQSGTALQLEESITALLTTYLDDPTAPDTETIKTSNVEIKFAKFDTKSGTPIKVGFDRGGAVEVKSEQYKAAMSEARLVVAEISQNLQELLPTSLDDFTKSQSVSAEDEVVEYQISSVIYNVILREGADYDLDITLTMDTFLPATDLRISQCAFLDLTKTPSTWSTTGMTKDSASTSRTIICRSTHLTNFAILMSVNEIPLTKAQETSLSVITYIGCTLSLVCLLITIILLFALRELQRSTRISILKHLAIAMFIAQLLFLAGVEPAARNEKLCTSVAVFLHYFFLAVMCWMLSQGLYLYLKLRRSAKGTWDFLYFCLLGWGFPVLLVAIVAGIKHEAYGTPTYCWLTTEDGAIWAFVGPALAIIGINTMVMIMAMKAFTSVKVYKDKSDKEKMRSSLRAIVVMLPILGLTWIFGVFSFNEETLFFQYLFAILNSLQGVFLFIFNVLWNDEIKGALRRKFGKKLSGSDESSVFFNRILGSASIAPASKSTETSFSTGTKM